MSDTIESLRAENERLKAENAAMREALRKLDEEARCLLERDDWEMECESVRELCRSALAHARAIGAMEENKQ